MEKSVKVLKSGYRSKLEAAYAAYLEVYKDALGIIKWGYEEIGFRMGRGVVYWPDFYVVTKTGEKELYEVKGPYSYNTGRVKFRTCASKFKEFRWFWVTRNKSGQWIITEEK